MPELSPTASATQLRDLLARCITDGAHHTRCARLSQHEELRLVHAGFAAGFRLAAMYAADTLATGSIQCCSVHHGEPADRAAALWALDHLPDIPADRAQLIHRAMSQSLEEADHA